jgi:hypothetical protein
MQIVVFSDNKSIEKCFDSLNKSKAHTLDFYPVSDLKRRIKNSRNGAFIYVDVSRLEQEDRTRILKYLSRLYGFKYGIIDERGVIEDSASLFHLGAADYVCKNILKSGITHLRIKKAATFRAVRVKEPTAQLSKRMKYIPSGRDWRGIKSGQEYTFTLMYIELDDKAKLKDSLSDHQLIYVTKRFKSFVQRAVAPLGGRLWIWNDFGGLVLFPYDGKSCEPIITCFRLMLSRTIFSVEELGYNKLYSYRIALHIGNTVYKSKGSTGTIVSSSINEIFHMGKKHVQPGNFFLTNEVYKYVPERMKKCFVPAGSFEEWDVMKMKLPD